MPRQPTPRKLSCGVLVTDGTLLLLGHATRSVRWDIPKGLAEPGEDPVQAALRELREETGLVATPADLQPLGTHAYLGGKDLALFTWCPTPLPDPAALRCTSMVALPGGRSMPELDRFGLFPWADALTIMGKGLAALLRTLRP